MIFLNGLQKRFNKNIAKIEKRLRFVIATFLLFFLMLVSTFFLFDKVIFFFPIFIIVTYVLSYFSILEGIEKIERIMLFITPVFFTVSFYLFYFLFPVRWITRLPFLIIFSVSFYAILLSSNIFNVGVEKSLQLFRAAFSINYLYQLIIIFVFLNFLFSLKLSYFFNAIGVGLIIFPLALQFLWSVKPKINLEKEISLYAFFISFVLFEITVVFSFIPVTTSIFSLVLAACYYCIAGLVYAHLDQRLFKETVREYLIVLGFVFLIVILSINW